VPEPAEPDQGRSSAIGPALVESLGGKRGLVDSGLPAVVFVLANSVVDAFAARSTALHVAIAAAVLTGAAIVLLRLLRRETVQQAVSGFLGLGLAVFFAARSGEARDFFKPGIYINAGYGLAFVVSAVVRWPLVGAIYAALDGLGSSWRRDRRLMRVFTVATIGWAVVYGSRAVVQALLYRADETGLLAASRLLMGWPPTILAVAATVAYVKRSHPRPAPEALGRVGDVRGHGR
jgi:hypothetical protein